MKFIIATGGSGGHIFPAINMANELNKRNCEIVFVGVFGESREVIEKKGYFSRELSAKGLATKSFISLVTCGFSMVKSIFESIMILRQVKPNAVVGFGSYAAFPMMLAAAFLRYPTMIHEQNVLPGQANNFLTKIVNKTAISFEQSKTFFRENKTIYTGCPCHQSADNYDKKQILRDYLLEENKFTMLVLGGSQGSKRINEAVLESLFQLKNQEIQVIHVAGRKNYEMMNTKYEQIKIPHKVFPFLDNIDQAYCIADIVISRAGAVTINELAAFGLKSILIPYPHAGEHQKENAMVLVEAQIAQIIEEKDLTCDTLRTAIINLKNQSWDREELVRRGRQIYRPNAASDLAREAIALMT